MTEPLTKIIKQEGIKTKYIEGEECLGLSDAARFIEVSKMTAYRLHGRGFIERWYKDPLNDHLYIPIEIVEKLRPDNRMIQILK